MEAHKTPDMATDNNGPSGEVVDIRHRLPKPPEQETAQSEVPAPSSLGGFALERAQLNSQATAETELPDTAYEGIDTHGTE